MPAYVIADIEITNPDGYATYRPMAADSVARHGGRFVARGGTVVPLEGGWDPEAHRHHRVPVARCGEDVLSLRRLPGCAEGSARQLDRPRDHCRRRRAGLSLTASRWPRPHRPARRRDLVARAVRLRGREHGLRDGQRQGVHAGAARPAGTAGQARRCVPAGAEAPQVQRRWRQARRSRDRVAQRSGLRACACSGRCGAPSSASSAACSRAAARRFPTCIR